VFLRGSARSRPTPSDTGFVQYAGLRAAWAQRRWMLLMVGIVFAAVIAHFFSTGVLSGPVTDPPPAAMP